MYGENLPKVEAPVQQAAHPADDSEHVLVLKSVLEELIDMRAQVETLLAERDSRNDEAA